MSIERYKKYFLVCTALLASHSFLYSGLSSNSRNDYFPLYTTIEPHAYLYTRVKEQLQGRTTKKDKINRFSCYISPFGQNANIGRDLDNNESELGNLNERWGMIGLLMGNVPSGQSYSTTLQEARSFLFNPDAPTSTTVLDVPEAVDCDQKFGFFKFPACYKKRGIRFQFTVGITDDVGFMMQAGASSINFNIIGNPTDVSGTTRTGCCGVNLTESTLSTCVARAAATYPNLTADNVNEYLMCKLKDIAHELERDLCDFHKTAMEDVRLYLYWRHAYEVNTGSKEYPPFLFIPFLSIGASLASGKERDPLQAFGLAHGNNGHNALGAIAGLNVDFTETIEIGAEFGGTHFFDNKFNDFPLPTSCLQSGIYPFRTSVNISPGFNWHFALKLNAHHFMDKLSFYFQWVVMEHMNDKICVTTPDSAFKPEVMECRSAWKAQMINTALNYDISEHIGLGFLWQAPVCQRNVFRSTTVIFGINFTF